MGEADLTAFHADSLHRPTSCSRTLTLLEFRFGHGAVTAWGVWGTTRWTNFSGPQQNCPAKCLKSWMSFSLRVCHAQCARRMRGAFLQDAFVFGQAVFGNTAFWYPAGGHDTWSLDREVDGVAVRIRLCHVRNCSRVRYACFTIRSQSALYVWRWEYTWRRYFAFRSTFSICTFLCRK